MCCRCAWPYLVRCHTCAILVSSTIRMCNLDNFIFHLFSSSHWGPGFRHVPLSLNFPHHAKGTFLLLNNILLQVLFFTYLSYISKSKNNFKNFYFFRKYRSQCICVDVMHYFGHIGTEIVIKYFIIVIF